jgi:hypothetical protein
MRAKIAKNRPPQKILKIKKALALSTRILFLSLTVIKTPHFSTMKSSMAQAIYREIFINHARFHLTLKKQIINR